MIPRVMALSKVRSTVIVSTMSAMIKTSRPSRMHDHTILKAACMAVARLCTRKRTSGTEHQRRKTRPMSRQMLPPHRAPPSRARADPGGRRPARAAHAERLPTSRASQQCVQEGSAPLPGCAPLPGRRPERSGPSKARVATITRRYSTGEGYTTWRGYDQRPEDSEGDGVSPSAASRATPTRRPLSTTLAIETCT